MFGTMFGFSFNLCARCLSDKEKPGLATPELITAFVDKETEEKARKDNKSHVCPRCELLLDRDEVLDRDEIIQILLISMEPEKLREATLRVVESNKDLREKARAEAEERAKNAPDVKYEQDGIFYKRVEEEKTDEDS